MNGRLTRMWTYFVSNFGRPRFDMGDDTKIEESDIIQKELEERRKELERRLRLREIQATPKGPFNV